MLFLSRSSGSGWAGGFVIRTMKIVCAASGIVRVLRVVLGAWGVSLALQTLRTGVYRRDWPGTIWRVKQASV